MATPSDPAEHALVVKAILCGVGGCCEWDDKAARRLRTAPPLPGLTPEGVKEELVNHLQVAGQTMTTKPFPWKCGHCRERAVRPAVVAYSTEAEYDGRTYTVTIPELKVPRCENCGEMVLDSAANRQITEALRKRLRLLTPEQIRASREALRLTQRELASHLGIAEATLSRWETGAQIQQRALDRLLRLYFSSARARDVLADEDRLAEVGASIGSQAGSKAESARRPPSEATRHKSRLARALDALPVTKRDSAVRVFQRLTELMK